MCREIRMLRCTACGRKWRTWLSLPECPDCGATDYQVTGTVPVEPALRRRRLEAIPITAASSPHPTQGAEKPDNRQQGAQAAAGTLDLQEGSPCIVSIPSNRELPAQVAARTGLVVKALGKAPLAVAGQRG
jgi:hypothetical protein